ncbi:MAG: alpha/beta fold hydrolase [Planctomycetes bacterium]|nr:alpha/beta fold hydrolase [Planctomycetota bacterium]
MFANIRGTEIFFDIDGMSLIPDGNRMALRPVLFLLHGGPGSDHSFFKSHVVAELRDTAQLVYIDHRGSGRSRACNPETCDLENNIEDVEALRQYLGLDRICLLGSSYGGMVAQGYAIRYSDRLEKLILSVTAPSYRFLEDAKRIVAERGTSEQKRVCQWLWDGNFETLEQRYEFAHAMGPLYSVTFDPEQAEATKLRSIYNIDQLNRGFGGFLREFDFTDQLPEISCPTLVLAGAHDWICPPHHSEIIAEHIPNARLKVFANSSHLIAADEPREYLATVREFLTESR